jgi:hypothetical protein
MLITTNAICNMPILVSMMMEAIISSETSVLTRAIWRHILEYGILQDCMRRNDFKIFRPQSRFSLGLWCTNGSQRRYMGVPYGMKLRFETQHAAHEVAAKFPGAAYFPLHLTGGDPQNR